MRTIRIVFDRKCTRLEVVGRFEPNGFTLTKKKERKKEKEKPREKNAELTPVNSRRSHSVRPLFRNWIRLRSEKKDLSARIKAVDIRHVSATMKAERSKKLGSIARTIHVKLGHARDSFLYLSMALIDRRESFSRCLYVSSYVSARISVSKLVQTREVSATKRKSRWIFATVEEHPKWPLRLDETLLVYQSGQK